MVNELRQGDDDLVLVDYGDLLDKIIRELRNQNPFRILSGGRPKLVIDIDLIADEVARQQQVAHPLGASPRSARAATINFSVAVEARFRQQILEIRDSLQQQLQSSLGQSAPIEQFAASLMTTNLQTFQGNPTNKLAFTYDFNKIYQQLEKQQLTLDRNNRPGSESILKLHKLTIAVENTGEFDSQLREGLLNYVRKPEFRFSPDQLEDINDSLDDLVEDQKSDFYRLQRLMDTEALGKLKREAQIKYLEYLLEQINTGTNTAPDPRNIYLQDLIRRLKVIDSYLNNEDREPNYYDVWYAGTQVNLRDIFARSDSLDALPIITIIDGYLGETTDEDWGERKFIFCLKLKFAGTVQSQKGSPEVLDYKQKGSPEVFDYNLNLINPDSTEHKNKLGDSWRRQFFVEKVLKLAFLYYFVLRNFGDLNYDPVLDFEMDVLELFLQDNETPKQNILRDIVAELRRSPAKEGIRQLKNLLQNILDRKTIADRRPYDLYIRVKQGILEDNPNNIRNGQFFKPILAQNPKAALRYIDLGEQSVDPHALCQLPVRLIIEDVRYFTARDRQQFSMEYNIEGIKALPVILTPKEDSCRQIYRDSLNQISAVIFSYSLERSQLTEQPTFIYRFSFLLLAYICLKILLPSAPTNLFIPILRLHQGDSKTPSRIEEFMADFSKVLSHLLNEEHRSSSQGFRVHTLDRYRIGNGLMSLYSVLPKKFRFPGSTTSSELDKLAIIIVSSKESDVRRGGTYKIANLMGEVIGVNRLQDGAIQIEMHKTFSDNEDSLRLSSRPTAIADTVNQLYYERGYQHFLYIAKAPYSRTLNITRREADDEGLFFLSRNVINELKGERSDIKIYPVFFDKYYVRKLDRNLKASSFYIQQTLELANLVDDPSKKTVVFFNLFNGIQVRNDSFYNGVISYATPLNIYQGILDDEDIKTGLIYNTPLKDTLLQYITLFHFTRYEAAPRRDRNISLKLDPYKNIIGEEALGKQSVFDHMSGGAEFNSLAFLTKVKEILNAPPGGR